MIQLITFVNYRAHKLNKYSLTRKYLLQKQNIIKRSATCIARYDYNPTIMKSRKPATDIIYPHIKF